jgi:triacylglycerol lipase
MCTKPFWLSPLLIFVLLVFQSAQAQQIDFNQIHQFATLAKAAYQPENSVKQAGYLEGFTLKQYRNIPEVEVSYLIAIDNLTRQPVIAIRGTANVENALVDIAVKLQDDVHAGIKLHKGFSQAASKIYQDIQPLIDKSTPVNLTGHSLGGAVAVILAMYLDHDGFQVGHVITFGQPKVTNVAGSRQYADLNLIRVVTPRDLVPLVPPLDPMDIQNLDIYWHAGKEVLLNTDSSYSILEGMTSMLRATKFTQQVLDEGNLVNHKMDLYMQLLESKLQQAEQIPFENDFNLFNLFGQ